MMGQVRGARVGQRQAAAAAVAVAAGVVRTQQPHAHPHSHSVRLRKPFGSVLAAAGGCRGNSVGFSG
eukprot:jgi/Mesen1/3111/ME000184S02186